MKITKTQRTYHVANFHAGEVWLGLSMRFGKLPENSNPVVSIIFPNAKMDMRIDFNLEKIIDEIIEGVGRANQEFHGNMQVLEIQIRANDNPERRVAEYVAYKIASFALQNQDT